MHFLYSQLAPFFLISLALHLVFLFSWPNLSKKKEVTEQIPVAFLPSPEVKKEPPKTPKEPPPTRPSKVPTRVAKKSTSPVEEIRQEPRKAPKEVAKKPVEREGPTPIDQEKEMIAQRPLPTLKELLPPVTWSPSGERADGKEGAVRLDTREPKYVSYFTSIKRAIELVWDYPEPALRHGLQGKLVLEFTILKNGRLNGTRLIRSSGFSVLDQEALRAVRAASPFHPIPPWIGKTRLNILASFEYYDNRLRYGFTP